MNEIKRAIKHFEGLQKRYTTQHNGKHCDLVATALDALREQTERSNGCEYCQSENSQGTDIWHGNQLSVGYGVYRAIKFCPMCGKSLEEVTNER